MTEILAGIREDAREIKEAPVTTPVRRIDEVRAARHLDVRYQQTGSGAIAQTEDD